MVGCDSIGCQSKAELHIDIQPFGESDTHTHLLLCGYHAVSQARVLDRTASRDAWVFHRINTGCHYCLSVL